MGNPPRDRKDDHDGQKAQQRRTAVWRFLWVVGHVCLIIPFNRKAKHPQMAELRSCHGSVRIALIYDVKAERFVRDGVEVVR